MPKAATPARPRRLPQRTCVGCGATGDKRELVRVVRTPEGQALADTTGKRPGRGAYICLRPECWQTALKKGRLEKSLKIRLAPRDVESLLAFASSMGLVGSKA